MRDESELVKEIECEAINVVADAGRTLASYTIGPNPKNHDVRAKLRGPFGHDGQKIVFAQARSEQPFQPQWGDQFAIQVQDTTKDFVRVRIRRIDDGANSATGWDLKLGVDLFVYK